MSASTGPVISPRAPSAARVNRRQRVTLTLFSLPLLLFLGLPLLALLLGVSPAQLLANLRQPMALQAIGLSLMTTLAAALLTVLFGTPLAYALAKDSLPWRGLIDTLVDLPTVLPPAVAGVALLLAFGRRGLLGGALEAVGVRLAFTTLAVVLAQTFVAAPFYIRSAAAGFRQVDAELEQAAGLDGANAWQSFRYVIVPLSWGSLVNGAVMTWARALGEFGATILFAGNFPGRTQTMPLAIYIGFEIDLGLAVSLSVILLGVSFVVLAVVKRSLGGLSA